MTEYVVLWLFRLLFTILVVVALLALTSGYSRITHKTLDVEASLLVDRMLLDSPLAYVDPHTHRVVAGVIDGAVDDASLDSSVCFDDCARPPLAAKFDVGGKILYFNKRDFDVWAPLDFGGPGGVDVVTLRRGVLLRGADGVTKPAVLVAEVRRPRE